MRTRLLLVLLLSLLPVSALSGSRSVEPWPGQDWPRSTPEAQGMSSVELASMLESIAAADVGIRSLLLIRHGHLVLDARIAPFRPGSRQDIHSCTKSVLSALVGIAIDRGELPGLDTPALEFFPELAGLGDDASKRAITLEHLLTMSAGLRTEDSYLYGWAGLRRMHASDDWARHVLSLPLDAEPGARFEYSNGVSQLIAIILQRETGRSLASYAREHLFGPLGIEEFTWQGSGPDDNWGYSGLRLDPRDMARLGYLFLRGGEWEGEQVLPARWVRESTRRQIPAGTLADDYGYQWWVGDGISMMLGHGGQYVCVLPEQDLVAVFTGSLERGRFFTPRRLLAESILPAVRGRGPLPADEAARTHLDALVQRLESGERAAPPPHPDRAAAVNGRAFEFEANALGLRRVNLTFLRNTPEARLEVDMSSSWEGLRIGLDGTYRYVDSQGRRWACRGRWEDQDTFVVDQELVGMVMRRRATFEFAGDSLALEVLDRVDGSVLRLRAGMAPPATR